MTTPDETNTASPQSSGLPPLSDSYPNLEPHNAWEKTVTWMRETVDGFVEFFGMLFSGLAVIVGGWGKLGLALGMGCLAAGFGTAVEAREGTGGPFWMFVGAFLIGLVTPLGKCKP